MKRILMVAFHFPPFSLSSGIQRTLRFVQHLPALGWEPVVLTAQPRAYEAIDNHSLNDIPAGTIVSRSFALDTARHLSAFKRYPGFLARPDRWVVWSWSAVVDGMRLIRRYRPSAIWSTFPIASAHWVGARLAKRSGLPWLADFRDPMAQDGYPTDVKVWQSFKRIEERTVRNSERCIFVTPGAANAYRMRYPDVDASRFVVIENGYDEESFAAAETSQEAASGPLHPGRVTLVHSGIVYPSERDPTRLFEALHQLVQEGVISPANLCFRFRAPVYEDLLRELSARHGLDRIVEILPAIPYRSALSEMLRADGLVVMQGATCDEQIPAKLYEYLRAGRPIIGLTNPAGDTASALLAAGVKSIAKLESTEEITRALREWLPQLRGGAGAIAQEAFVLTCSRRERSRELAMVLDELA